MSIDNQAPGDLVRDTESTKELKDETTKPRWIVIVGIIVAVAVIAASGVLLWKSRQGEEEGQTVAEAVKESAKRDQTSQEPASNHGDPTSVDPVPVEKADPVDNATVQAPPPVTREPEISPEEGDVNQISKMATVEGSFGQSLDFNGLKVAVMQPEERDGKLCADVILTNDRKESAAYSSLFFIQNTEPETTLPDIASSEMGTGTVASGQTVKGHLCYANTERTSITYIDAGMGPIQTWK